MTASTHLVPFFCLKKGCLLTTGSCISSPDRSPSFAGGSEVVPTLDELLTADPDKFVARHPDIASVNLACARGLPSCDEREFPKYLALLDTIAEAVKRQTERSWRLFKLKPQEFLHSENVFRVYTMEYVFRAQFGIKYDPTVRQTLTGPDGQRDMAKSWQSTDSSEIFIHGILSDNRTGTCSSLPTFAIAVGRRLGYPLHLILVPNHTLYRWDDGQEVFNLQPHDAGGEVKPDEYFHTWPRQWTPDDFRMNERTKVWLHSLTPRKEVSKFLCNRALMLRDTKRYTEAMEAVRAAERFDPINPACADIEFSIQYGMTGGDVNALIYGNASPVIQGGSFGWTHPLMQTQFVGSLAISHDKTCDDRDFAKEHYPLVNLINESNRNRSPQHPDGNPPTGPLLRQLADPIKNRKEHQP